MTFPRSCVRWWFFI